MTRSERTAMLARFPEVAPVFAELDRAWEVVELYDAEIDRLKRLVVELNGELAEMKQAVQP